MKPKKIVIIFAILGIILITAGIFIAWYSGESLDPKKVLVDGFYKYRVNLAQVTGLRVILTGLTTACISQTVGMNWSIIPLLLPFTVLVTLFFLIFPWRKRGTRKSDGVILLVLTLLIFFGWGNWQPVCPEEIVSHWSHWKGPVAPGTAAVILGMLLLFTTAIMILATKKPKQSIEG
jgi:hypothetical protein